MYPLPGGFKPRNTDEIIRIINERMEEETMSKGNKGFGHPTPIEPISHSKNLFWQLLGVPVVLFFAILISIGVAALAKVATIHGVAEIPKLLDYLLDGQSAVLVILPIVLTALYYTIINIKKAWLHGIS